MNFKTKCILKIPFISYEHSNEIKKYIKQSDLPILPIFTSGPSIISKLTKSSLNHQTCNIRNCYFKNESFCRKKNVIYELTCLICKERYIGETKRELHHRLNEHVRHTVQGNITNSAFAEHYQKLHHNNKIPEPPFSVKILDNGRDSADCFIREATSIRKEKPSINRDRGWISLANNFK